MKNEKRKIALRRVAETPKELSIPLSFPLSFSEEYNQEFGEQGLDLVPISTPCLCVSAVLL